MDTEVLRTKDCAAAFPLIGEYTIADRQREGLPQPLLGLQQLDGSLPCHSEGEATNEDSFTVNFSRK